MEKAVIAFLFLIITHCESQENVLQNGHQPVVDDMEDHKWRLEMLNRFRDVSSGANWPHQQAPPLVELPHNWQQLQQPQPQHHQPQPQHQPQPPISNEISQPLNTIAPPSPNKPFNEAGAVTSIMVPFVPVHIDPMGHTVRLPFTFRRTPQEQEMMANRPMVHQKPFTQPPTNNRPRPFNFGLSQHVFILPHHQINHQRFNRQNNPGIEQFPPIFHPNSQLPQRVNLDDQKIMNSDGQLNFPRLQQPQLLPDRIPQPQQSQMVQKEVPNPQPQKQQQNPENQQLDDIKNQLLQQNKQIDSKFPQQVGQPLRFPQQNGQLPRFPPQDEEPPRFVPQEDKPPRFPPQEDKPPRFPPQVGHPLRFPSQDGQPRFPPQDGQPRFPPQDGQPQRLKKQDEQPPRFPPQDGPPPRFPPQDSQPSRLIKQDEQPPRFPPQNGQPPRFPPQDDQPPRFPPQDGHPPRFPHQDGQPPRFPPQDGQPPRFPPQDDQPSRFQPKDSEPPRFPPQDGQSPRFPKQNDLPPRFTPQQESQQKSPQIQDENQPFKRLPEQNGHQKRFPQEPPQEPSRFSPPNGQQQRFPPADVPQSRPPFPAGIQQQQQKPPFQEQQRPPFQEQQRPPFQEQQRPPFQEQQRPPFQEQQRPPFQEHQRPPFQEQQRPHLPPMAPFPPDNINNVDDGPHFDRKPNLEQLDSSSANFQNQMSMTEVSNSLPPLPPPPNHQPPPGPMMPIPPQIQQQSRPPPMPFLPQRPNFNMPPRFPFPQQQMPPPPHLNQPPPPRNVKVPKIFGDFPTNPRFDMGPWIPITPLPKINRKPVASPSREALRVENPPSEPLSTTQSSRSVVISSPSTLSKQSTIAMASSTLRPVTKSNLPRNQNRVHLKLETQINETRNGNRLDVNATMIDDQPNRARHLQQQIKEMDNEKKSTKPSPMGSTLVLDVKWPSTTPMSFLDVQLASTTSLTEPPRDFSLQPQQAIETQQQQFPIETEQQSYSIETQRQEQFPLAPQQQLPITPQQQQLPLAPQQQQYTVEPIRPNRFAIDPQQEKAPAVQNPPEQQFAMEQQPPSLNEQPMSPEARQQSVELLYNQWKLQFGQTQNENSVVETPPVATSTEAMQAITLMEQLSSSDLRPSDWSHKTSALTKLLTPTPPASSLASILSSKNRRRQTQTEVFNYETVESTTPFGSVITPKSVITKVVTITTPSSAKLNFNPSTIKVAVRRRKVLRKKVKIGGSTQTPYSSSTPSQTLL